MSEPCKHLNPLQRDGTSQPQRLLAALKSSYVSVDERTTADLLQYALKYSKLLQYYTETNSPGGNWEDFIKHDISVLITDISTFNHAELKEQFQKNWEAVLNTAGLDKKKAFAEIFPTPVQITAAFDRWYRHSIEGLSLHGALVRMIKSVLNDALRDLLGCAVRAQEVHIMVEQIKTENYSKIWDLSNISPDYSLFQSGAVSAEEIEHATEKVGRVFDKMYEALVFIVKNSSDFLNQSLEEYPGHQSHMALFLTFIKLFKHAQDHLNTITAEHLRFYYEEVLQLTHRPERPDKVHLVFELAKHATPHPVDKDTLVKAGKDGKGVERFYGVDDEIVVNSAALDDKKGLKNVFIDKHQDGVANPIIVKNIYAAMDADSADGMGATIEDEDGKWLTFGGKNMPYAQIGFAVASPMFLLAEGTRAVTLRFELKKPVDFLASEPGRQDRELIRGHVEKELKYNVKVFASGEKDWLPVTVKETEISDSTGSSRAFVSYELNLSADVAPVVPYNSKALDGGFDTKWPVIRFILDNEGLTAKDNFDFSKAQDIEEYSDQKEGFSAGTLVRHERQVYEARRNIEKPGFRPSPDSVDWKPIEASYPYKYFQRMEIELLVINVDVQGVQNLILENDIGTLNTAKPFHAFGPVPRARSSFLIGSYEIFQKSLKSLQLRIQWADLPIVNFKSYYDKYKTNDGMGDSIVRGNEYFQATFSILSTLKGWDCLDTVNTTENTRVISEIAEHEDIINSVAFSPKNEKIITASADKTVRLWNAKGGKEIAVLKSHEAEVYSAAFSPDGQLIVTASGDTTARLWNAKGGKEIAFLKGHEAEVYSAAFSPDGQLIVTASGDKSVRLWNAKGGKEIAFLKGHEAEVYSAAFSPDGQLIVTASGDKSVRLWNAKGGKEIAFLKGHEAEVYSAAFSPDGQLIVTASGDKSVRLWNAKGGKEIAFLKGHEAEVYSAAFSPDGQLIVTASGDKSVRLWNAKGGKEIAAINTHTSRLKSAAFNSDGTIIGIGGDDGVVKLWEEGNQNTLFFPHGTFSKPYVARDISFELDADIFTRDPELKPFSQFDRSLRQGFMRAQLITDFLHSQYPRLLAAAAASDSSDIPNEPYTPLMTSLTLDYQAEETIDFSSKKKDDYENRVEQIFQIWPFGQAEVYPIADDPTADDILIDRKLVPEFKVTVKQEDGTTNVEDAEGTLYIGLDKLVPPQNLSILFQVAEGSEDPQLLAQEVMWSYLSDNQWFDFKTSEVIADKTNGLLTSGVIKLAMPKIMTDTDTIMTPKLHWVKASVPQDTGAVSKIIAIHPQAGVASFRNQGNDPAHLSKSLAAGAISKLKSRVASIKSVSQPYASFGGRMKEKDRAFQIRVSERLRHKARAISIFDYERMVLKNYPQIYKVKCINHTSDGSEYAPGNVLVIVVPDLRNKNAVDPLRPRVSKNTLEEIKEYLSGISSDFITISVNNPDYEKIQVHFNVRFRPGRDKGLYTARLNDDIKKFLSPWLYDDTADLKFGGRIHRSHILKHVEDQEYVDFVTGFRLDQFIEDEDKETHFPDIEEAAATTSSSVLVSAPEHLIEHDIKSCEDAQDMTAA